VAVFGAHVSAQVTAETKGVLGDVLAEDKTHRPSTSEGDVIRLALAVGMSEVTKMPADRRVVAYAYLRGGLPLPA
jgi:hypothetical protein